MLLTASGQSAAHLPLDRPVRLHDLLSSCVELQEAASRAQIREMAAYTVCPPHKHELEGLLEEGVYQEQILTLRVSMLDLLEKYEACELPFERFLELLRPLKPRYYSISSSPLKHPGRLQLPSASFAAPPAAVWGSIAESLRTIWRIAVLTMVS